MTAAIFRPGMCIEAVANHDPYWDKVELLLHGEGTIGSTTITDSSQRGRTVVSNSAKIDVDEWTGVAKFESGCISTRDSNSSFTVAMGDDGLFSGDFTIEMWVNKWTGSDTVPLCVTANDGSKIVATNSFLYRFDASDSMVWAKSIYLYSGSHVWTHLALTRNNGVVRWFSDGSKWNQWNDNNTWDMRDWSFCYFPYFGSYWNGYYDEIRITKGACRYTKDFTVQSAPWVGY